MAKSEIPVGIDLGTTFSAIAYLDNEGRPCTITNSEGELTTPSVVFFDRDAVIIGTEANFAGETDANRLARAAKRDMGGARYRKAILNRHLPPEVIQSYVLKRLKDDAELKLGKFKKAVITVPAYFNEPRRKATQDAGELAGLDVIDIINEPTAAALAYGVQSGFINKKGEAEERELILVYDLGGGTFDVTLMDIDKSRFTAVATAGDVYLGGIDWDQRVFEYAKKEIESNHDVKFESDSTLQEKLMNQCVRAKRTLSARSETVIRIEHEAERYKVDLTREKFEDLTKDLLERTRLTMDRLLRDAKLKWSDLTKLLLVGGSTRMPMVLSMLEKESGLKVDRSLSPDESVAHGAAIYAGILLKHGSSVGQGISVSNVNSHDLGVLGVDPQTGEPRRRIVIPRNHMLPAKSSKKFQTSKDGQKKIVVQIVEGGTEEGHGATTIGKCVVTDLPPDIKKGTEVLVSFNYLNSGRINVVAEIPSLKLSANTAIDRAEGMTKEKLEEWKNKIAKGVEFLEAEPVVGQKSKAKPPSAERPIVADQKTKTAVPPKNSDSKKSDTKSKPKKPVEAKSKSFQPTSPVVKSKQIEKPTPKPKVDVSKVQSKPVGKMAKKTGADQHSKIDSAILAIGEEKKRPEVGESALNVLNENIEKKPWDNSANKLEFDENSAIFAFGDEEKKPDPGASVLDFLRATGEKKSSASGSSLDDFLADLD